MQIRNGGKQKWREIEKLVVPYQQLTECVI